MQEVSFNALRHNLCSFADLGSTRRLFSRALVDWRGWDLEELRSLMKLPEAHQGGYFSQKLQETHANLREPLRLLETLVLNDYVAIDAVLLDDAENQGVFKAIAGLPYFKACRVPDEVRDKAAKQIIAEYQHFSGWNNSPEFIFDWGDKEAHDLVAKVGGIFCCANSDDSVQRALYYLNISREGKVPLVVTNEKQEFIEKAEERIRKNIHEVLSKGVLGEAEANKLKETVNAHFAEYAGPELPFLQEQILLRSICQEIPLLEAALEIRREPEVVEYRKFVTELRLLTEKDDRKDFGERLNKFKKEYQYLHGLEYEGKRLVRRRLAYKTFPPIKWLVEMAGMKGEVSVPDLLLTQPDPALMFFYRWSERVRFPEVENWGKPGFAQMLLAKARSS